MKWLKKSPPVAMLALCLVMLLGASDPASRFNDLGHKMMCTCGCGQVLLECNHVGCPSSDGMRHELMAALDRGSSDDLVLQSFVQKYGPTVLAAPTTKGFNRVAWIMPFAVLLVAMLATTLLVRKWSLRPAAMPETTGGPELNAIRERIRRETDLDGGSQQ